MDQKASAGDGGPVHLTRWGSSGPKVVLVHGSAQGSRVGGDQHFSAQEPLTARGWQLIVPDRPGHGRSRSLGGPDDAEVDGEWVADLVADGAHLVGHSFGGCVALAAAARRPHQTRSLTLIEPGMQKLAIDNPHVRRLVLRIVATLIFSASASRRARRFMNLVNIPPEMRGKADPLELNAMGRGIARLKLPSAKVLRGQLEVIAQSRIPLLVVTGGWSPAFDAVGERVAAVGGGHHKVIASPHHFPNLVSDEFNLLLDEHMRGAESQRAASGR